MITLTIASVSAQEKAPKNNRLTVKAYTVSGVGSVNSYLVVSEEGLIVIDTRRVLSEGQNLLREVKATGKPLGGFAKELSSENKEK